ncbi:hypothetical protein [Deinococcus wulumuqiensis]|uniref:hypothetical protein n=1 Tax=Deinococcus wulumuqiensis TaxID=980427 RepID=UPI00243151D1|nr:hypothetical protein [Deinococcus wulumuqiensis]
MKRRALAPLLVACVLGVTTLPAQATTAPPLTLAQQASRAEVIVRVTLGSPKTVKDGDVTYQVYPLDVAEVIAGDPATLPQYEGKPALFVLQGTQDLPAFAAGQEGVALLYARRLDSPLVGFSQGWYPVVGGKVTAGDREKPITDPAALRDAIRAARGAQ